MVTSQRAALTVICVLVLASMLLLPATRQPTVVATAEAPVAIRALRPPVNAAAHTHHDVGVLTTQAPIPCTSRLMPIASACSCRQRVFNVSALSVTSPAASLDSPEDALSYCELALLHTDACARDEYASECVLRLGPAKLQRWLARRCTKSEWFGRLLNRSVASQREELPGRTSGVGDPDKPEKPLGGVIVSSVIDSGAPQPYVPPEERPKGHVIPWRASPYLPCEYNRLTIAIPAENIVERVEHDKLFDVYPLVLQPFPLQATYAFGSNDEVVLREAQRRSYFTTTYRRGGQCLYDGLASGSIPIFADLHLSAEPEVDLPMYPVDLLMEARRLPGVRYNFVGPSGTDHPNFVDEPVKYGDHSVYNFRSLPTVDWDVFDSSKYFRLAERLLEYTKANLTTVAVATHFLRALNKENARRVLMIHTDVLPEMMTLLHGLASLGIEVHSSSIYLHYQTKFPRGTTEIEASAERQQHIWPGVRSSGHSFMFRSPRSHVIECYGDACLELILQRVFDLVVYSVSHGVSGTSFDDDERHYPHFAAVTRRYTREEVVFIDGADGAQSLTKVAALACKAGRIFSRERPFAPTKATSER